MAEPYPYAKAVMRMGTPGTAGGASGTTRFNFDTDKFGVMLLTSAYTLTAATLDTHEFVSDVVASEVVNGAGSPAAVGYARVALANPTFSFVDDTAGSPGNIGKFADGADVATVFLNLTATFRYLVVYRYSDSTGTFDPTPPGDTDATAPLLSVVDFEADKTSLQPGSFTIGWPSTGILRFKAVQTNLGG